MPDTLLDLDPSLNTAPASFQTIHLMGIGGTAMAAIAGMLQERGYRISGSDRQLYPPMSELLARLGIEVFSGYAADNLHHRPDLVIVGNVISRDNPEAQALAEAGIHYLSMPQALSRFFIAPRRSLVVAGTHGKTTTSSMLAAALHRSGADPGFMIGGIVKGFETNFRLGAGAFFITEGDEYDTAFFDKESKFLHYRPEIAVITSIEFDHADIFTDIDQIKAMFGKFVRLIPPRGLLVVNGDDDHVADIVGEASCEVQRYGTGADCDWRLGAVRQRPGATDYDLSFRGRPFLSPTIALSGVHNCLNSTAVTAVLHHLGIAPAMIGEGLLGFAGVKRRQEVRGVVRDIMVIDDFAHHPTAVRETLEGLQRAYADRRLIAVFEPRSNTSRRSLFQHAYAASFGGADISIIKEPPLLKAADAQDRLSAEQLARELKTRGQHALSFPDTDRIIDYLAAEARPGDLVAILSNGSFDNIHARLLEALKNEPAR